MDKRCSDGCQYYEGVYHVDGIAPCRLRKRVVQAFDVCENYLPQPTPNDDELYDKLINELKNKTKN